MAPLPRPLRAGDGFWQAIERCLVVFHGWDATRAHERVERFIADLAPVRSHGEDDLILHAEPFELAGDLAGTYLSPFEHRQRYNEIVDAYRQTWIEGYTFAQDVAAAPNLVGRDAGG